MTRGVRAFSEKQLSFLASQLANLPVTESTSPTLLKLTTAVLLAGDMALWMGPGRRIIESAWDSPRPDHGLTLCGALADLRWGGWKMIAVPSLTKVIPRLLLQNDHGGRLVLHLLASLHREGNLWELNPGCRTALEEHVCARLGTWEKGEESVSCFSFASLTKGGGAHDFMLFLFICDVGTRAVRHAGTRDALSFRTTPCRAHRGSDAAMPRPKRRLRTHIRKLVLDLGCLYAVSSGV